MLGSVVGDKGSNSFFCGTGETCDIHLILVAFILLHNWRQVWCITTKVQEAGALLHSTLQVPAEPPPFVDDAFYDALLRSSLEEMALEYVYSVKKAIVDYVIM